LYAGTGIFDSPGENNKRRSEPVKRHVMSVLVERSPISFNRVMGMLARKGYSIEKLTIRGTEDPGVSRITFTVICEDWTVGQLEDQLKKLADVIKTESGQGASRYNGAILATAK
jgi:acetolactate synthase small subunit